ncbi:MAG: GNAT family N-acetyltransferase [Capsulimonas sp.]|uniref:GNAT family N-acetyltransferase n=1 Tax=Capsulimonas sp. TaxID=2494211 RepID=UPI003266E418
MPSHSNDISMLIQEATRWLASRSIAQWETPWSDEWIAWKVEIGEFYCVFEGDVMVGVVRLIWSDTEMWDESADSAGYVHTLIVRRDFTGHGIGRVVLGWAEEQCLRRGAEYLRLDCRASNPELNRYYVEQGFVACGEKTVDGYCGRLYQKRLVIP